MNFFIHRLTGPENPVAPGSSLMAVMAAMTPFKFLAQPGLWVGLIITAGLLLGAVRLRRYKGPV
jgi:hypothetical protein